MAYTLRRMTDGAGDTGSVSEAIAWNEDGTFKEIVGSRPTVGCSVRVGSAFARSYSDQDWWLTTPVTEILEESESRILFKTKNSTYEWTQRKHTEVMRSEPEKLISMEKS